MGFVFGRALLLALISFSILAGCGPESDSRPAGGARNVLLITIDTLRADHLGCYGYDRARTPAIDGIASKGVLFEDALTSIPITLPSHASILTGLFPPEHGIRENDDTTLRKNVTTLAEVFRRGGYKTGAFVGAFVLDSMFGLDRGFDVYDDDFSAGGSSAGGQPKEERTADKVVDSALSWLEANKGSPFFCWVHLFDPHAPYTPPAPYGGEFKNDPYDGEIAFTDSQVKRLSEWLDAEGLSARTLIAIAADHGEGLGEHDEPQHCVFLYGATLHVPLIFSLPGTVVQGRRVGSLVSTVDIFPTITEFFGLKSPAPSSGRSLAPALRGKDLKAGIHFAMSDYAYDYYGWSPLRSITTAKWKYIRAPTPELYDRARDPGETRNLAGKNPQVLGEMEKKLASIEAGFSKKKTEKIALTGAQRHKLEALGYAAGGTGGKTPKAGLSLKDPKEMAGVLNRWTAALDMMRGGNPRGGIAALKKIAGENPDIAFFQSSLGSMLGRMGDLRGALDCFRKALEIHERSGLPATTATARIHSSYAMALSGLGKHDEAMEEFRKSLKIDPTSAETLNNLAAELARKGEFLESVLLFRKALALAPKNETVSLSLAAALRSLANDPRRYEEGLALLDRGESVKIEDAAVADVMARVLAACPEDSKRDLKKALDLAERECKSSKGQNPVFLDTLAIVYSNLGRYEEALSLSLEAVKIARRYNDANLANALLKRIDLYRKGKAFRF